MSGTARTRVLTAPGYVLGNATLWVAAASTARAGEIGYNACGQTFTTKFIVLSRAWPQRPFEHRRNYRELNTNAEDRQH